MAELKIVQFAHPGGEYSLTRAEIAAGVKQWNYGRHQRKFICAKGQYVDASGNLSHEQDLLFWGEWEPSSRVSSVVKTHGTGVLPKWIHYPQLEVDKKGKVVAPYFNGKTVKIKKKCNGKVVVQTVNCARQNTDPFVFGDAFYYSCCKQRKKENNKCTYTKTKMCFLDKGSIIIFGSTIDSYFEVDTVFVVGESRPYKVDNFKNDLNGFIPKDYDQIMGFSHWIPTDEFVCYRGATPSQPINGMFSFVPCRTTENGPVGFPRMRINQSMLSLISDNLNAAPKYTPQKGNAATADVKQVWNQLCIIAASQGFLLGVNFQYQIM